MACFHDDADYGVLVRRMRAVAAKYRCDVHAYCLMGNHLHVLMTPRRTNACADFMKDLSQPYAHYFNRKYARTGTLWEGRYRSCVAESARYVLACYRYIELNPVRAGIVRHPGLYPWSSYAINCGDRSDPMIVPHAEFQALATTVLARQAVYRALLDEGLEGSVLEAIQEATSGGYPPGSKEFKSRLAVANGRRLEPGRPGPRSAKPAGRNSVPDPDPFG